MRGRRKPTGVDLGELLRVADQYELPAGLGGVTQELDQPTAAQHRGLVDHHDAAVDERGVTGLEVGEELVGGVRADPGTGFELPCGRAESEQPNTS